MSWKGHKFTEDDLPPRLIAGAKVRLGDKYADWLKQRLSDLTEKYRIVAHDKVTGEDIIAEEIDQKAIACLPPEARSAAGTLLALPADVRSAVIAAFNQDGSLAYPFKMK